MAFSSNHIVGDGRISIKEEADGITVRIKSKKNWFALIFIPLCVAVTAFAFVAGGIGQDWRFADVLSWLVFGLVITAIPIFALIWNIWGEEVISIGGGRFTRKLSVGGIGLKRSFPVNEVFNVRTSGVHDGVDKERNDRFWWPLGLAEETVAVSTIYLTNYCFGIRLEGSDAEAVAKALEPYLPAPSNYSLNPTGYNVPPIRKT